MTRLFADYLEDMLEAMDAATEFTQGVTAEQFCADRMRIYATIRALEVLGEPAKRIPDEVRGRWPGISWRKMAEVRDVVIHEYDDVDLAVVWDIVEHDIPVERLVVEQALRDQEAREANA